MVQQLLQQLVMDRRICWNASRLKEIDEAKSIITPYLRAGYEVVKADGTKVNKFHPSLEVLIIKASRTEGKRVLKILSEAGDERIVWNKEYGNEAKEAKKKFAEFLAKGYKAYSVDSQGKKNRKIEEFDVDAEEILMIPATAKS